MKTTAFSKITHSAFPGSSVLRQWPLQGGVSANMFAVDIQLETGYEKTIVFRQHQHAEWKPSDDDVTTKEYNLLQFLHNNGFKVPKPLYLDASASLLDSPFFLMEFLDGCMQIEKNTLEASVQKMALFLSALHAVDPVTLSSVQLPFIENPIEGIQQYLPQVMDDTVVLDRINKMTIKKVDNSLLHGDFWPHNILWQDGEIQAVVDWEDAAIGDPMADIACSRVEIFCYYGRTAMDQFTNHYFEHSKEDASHLVLWEIYVASSALATMHNWGLKPKDEQHRRQITQIFLKEAIENLSTDL